MPVPRRRRAGAALLPALLVALTAVLAPATPATAATPLRVMPIGDSITESIDGQATWRYFLYDAVRGSGRSIDLVGSRTGVGTSDTSTVKGPKYPDFDQDHDGHSGWRAEHITAGRPGYADQGRLSSWLPEARPDVVLLHIGTNDIKQCETVASTVDDVDRILTTVRAANPAVTVLLAQIIPTTTASNRWCARDTVARVAQYNAALASLATARSTTASPIVVVDQHRGFDLAADTTDGVHPDESGDQKMGARWYEALAPLLGEAEPPPPPPDATEVRGTPSADTDNGTRRTVTLAVPAGTSAGDVLVAAVAVKAPATVATPAEWSLAAGWPRTTGPASNGVSQYLFTRPAAGATTGAVAFTKSVNARHTAALVTVAGANASAPIAASAVATGATSTVALPTTTAPAAGTLVVAVTSAATYATTTVPVTPPAGFVEVVEAGRPYLTTEVAVATVPAGTTPSGTYRFGARAESVVAVLALAR